LPRAASSKRILHRPELRGTTELRIVVNYVSVMRNSKIRLVVNQIKSFYEKGLVLTDDSKLEADVIIFGTR
jgi:cation diffusion facilitator CzcD-associated flavoprotein CzcO